MKEHSAGSPVQPGAPGAHQLFGFMGGAKKRGLQSRCKSIKLSALRQMCDVILRFAEEGEEFHGKAWLAGSWR